MIIFVYIGMRFIPVNINSKLSCVIYIALNAIIGGVVYIGLVYKMGILESAFGKSYLDRIKKKFIKR